MLRFPMVGFALKFPETAGNSLLKKEGILLLNSIFQKVNLYRMTLAFIPEIKEKALPSLQVQTWREKVPF